ncbi:hypothetical protein SAMN04489806_2667 [Paramicrobacterium humi]|uniref:Glyoxalase-like domain-containing protein n=1 Tax=Paramicrobacterium humi TaxID=640635 RepID=A0A1H4PZQ7_9MICO|nr:VOC family protein [Microbacterium humi]SEC12801.1 hypothetical protein SAMN04489806_2667 [Microbacterium humi]
MAYAAFPSVVIDCPDADALATFYADMLGWNVEQGDDGEWVDIRPDDRKSCISFQSVENYRAPEWPGQEVPQQMHIDVMVRDLDESEAATLAAGATKAETQPGETFRVFLDPAGHPFCLCLS